jgi:hypothetical protein
LAASSDFDIEIAWTMMFETLISMEDIDATWLAIATELLSFCAQFPPSAEIWGRPPAGEPWGTILAIEASATSVLKAVDPELFANLDDEDADDTDALSYATPEHIEALHQYAEIELSDGPFLNRRLSLVAVARALAGAIDNLVGNTYIEWFKNLGEVKLEEGRPYPTNSHDPRPWLDRQESNSNPANSPGRDLSWTHRLRIAGASHVNYVIDFDMWNRLGPIGADHGFVAAVAQPNHHLGEFDIRWHNDDPRSYANHGPQNHDEQTARISRLVETATAAGAEVVLLPEYSLTEKVRNDLLASVSKHATRPLLLCSGISTGAGDHYVANEAWSLVVTPGIDRSYSPKSPEKIYGAKVNGYDERIYAASEVRIYMSDNWTIAPLICRDAMDDAILNQLAVLGTNLLLVPAMSEKTATMVGAVSALCHKSQAFIALANGPAEWTYPDPPAALSSASGVFPQTFPRPVDAPATPPDEPTRYEGFFAGPYGSHPYGFPVPPRGGGRREGELGLWLFAASEKSITPRIVTMIDNS